MKYFVAWSEYEIGNSDHPYTAYFQAKSRKDVDRYLENYCCDNDLDYYECCEEGLIGFKEVQLKDVFWEL